MLLLHQHGGVRADSFKFSFHKNKAKRLSALGPSRRNDSKTQSPFEVFHYIP